jgi:hypothetical protein
MAPCHKRANRLAGAVTDYPSGGDISLEVAPSPSAATVSPFTQRDPRSKGYRDNQHMISSTPEEVTMVAEVGWSLSVTPYTEMRTGFGFPKVREYLEGGVRVGWASTPPIARREVSG